MAGARNASRGPPVRPTRVVTETWFFPLTALYGVIAVPMFVLDWGLALLLLFTLLLRFRQPDQPG